MLQFYSQHGEDTILNSVFENQNTGFFVEVGCIDGKRFSNTLFFEKKGWKGMCIEAHSDYIEMIKKNRPNSVVVHCAVGESDEDNVTFYANARGSLSSLDKSTEERWKRDYNEFFSGFEEQKVSKRTLTTIFKQYNIHAIDILSIDIEGYEIQALQGLDLKTYKPKVIVIESDNKEHQSKLNNLLFPFGYKLILNHAGNVYYSYDDYFAHILLNKKFKNIHLVHTTHPLDKQVDKHQIINININKSSSLISSLKQLIKILIRGNAKTFSTKRRLSQFYNLGFHGDMYLIDFVSIIAQDCDQFVETGTNVASTLSYFARRFPAIQCFSCESDFDSYDFAKNQVSDCPNVILRNESSPGFLSQLVAEHPEIVNKKTIFWLDAHDHGFQWPLREEVNFITSRFSDYFLFIDDFKVPHNSSFGFDVYEKQVCSFDFINGYLKSSCDYLVVYPAYSDRTSRHHPLRGWGLIVPVKSFHTSLPENLKQKILITGFKN